MRIIKCDFCKKEIKERETKIGIDHLNSKSYELCNKCFKKFEKLANDFQKEIEELTKGG